VPGRLVTLPIRLTVDLLKLPLEGTKLALALIRELVEEDPPRAPARPGAPSPATAGPPSAPRTKPPPPRAEPPARAEPFPRAPEPFDGDPLEPVHVSEEPELVAESADPEAADSGTAEVHVDEPWDGYRHLKADDVIGRVGVASAEELAVIELYERTHRGRKTVLAAVEKQLRILTNAP